MSDLTTEVPEVPVVTPGSPAEVPAVASAGATATSSTSTPVAASPGPAARSTTAAAPPAKPAAALLAGLLNRGSEGGSTITSAGSLTQSSLLKDRGGRINIIGSKGRLGDLKGSLGGGINVFIGLVVIDNLFLRVVGTSRRVVIKGSILIGRKTSVSESSIISRDSTNVGLLLGTDVIIDGVKGFGLGTVKVEPPVADEVVLVEDGSVGAEEGVLGEATVAISGTDVEHLAEGLRVGVVS